MKADVCLLSSAVFLLGCSIVPLIPSAVMAQATAGPAESALSGVDRQSDRSTRMLNGSTMFALLRVADYAA
jgi:hypothetical protein